MILGIDPGLVSVGWAVADKEPLRHYASGVLKIPKGLQPARLLALWRALELAPIKQFDIQQAVIESAFVGKHSQSALKFAEAVGVIKLWLAHREYPVRELAPATIKKIVTGSGQAKKADVIAAVENHVGYAAANSHEADAIAAAIAEAIAESTY